MYIGFAIIMAMIVLTMSYNPMSIDLLGLGRVESKMMIVIILVYKISLILYSLGEGDLSSRLMRNKYVLRVIKAGFWRGFLLEDRDYILSVVKKIYRRSLRIKRSYERLIANRKLLKHTERKYVLERLRIELNKGDIIKLSRLLRFIIERRGLKRRSIYGD